MTGGSKSDSPLGFVGGLWHSRCDSGRTRVPVTEGAV